MSEQKEFEIGKFETNKSLFIEASAGTGKTYTIQLMVAKMIAEGTPLKKILIVTYTEKAAGELKDRIRKKINEVLEKHKIDKHEPELDEYQLAAFRKAYQDVDNAAIFTIHSFCQKALKEYAYDAGRPFDMTMIDDAAVEDFVEQLIRDRWAKDEEFNKMLDLSNKPSSLIDDVKELFVRAVDLYKGKDSAGNEIVILDPVDHFTFLDETLKDEDAIALANSEKHFESLCCVKRVKQNYDILKLHKDEFFDAVQEQKGKDVAKNGKSVADFIDTIEKWNGSGEAGLFGSPQFGNKLVKANCDETLAALQFFFDINKSVCGVISKNAKRFADKFYIHKFVIDHLPQLFNEWQQYKSENKLQSFNDMILSVHQAVLSSDNSLKSRLRAQYKYAIIDEFQDTNQLQWDIFRNVFLKDGESPVAEHSIFVVGDPKQSIYSFQGADVNVYKAATEEIKNRNDLLCNYRSTDQVIHGCTALFEGDFFNPAEDMPELIKFSGSGVPSGPNADKKKAQPQIDGVETASIWLSDADISPEKFAKDAVAKIIDWCSFDKNGKTRLQVFDKDDSLKLRNVSFKDFAILAKSRSEMENIESTMRNAGIPYMRYKEANLFKSRECAEWIALFRAINAPDFSSWNRKLLSEVLITDFFKDMVAAHTQKSVNTLDILYSVESEYFDDPNIQERMFIAAWRSLAIKHRYAELLEQIYRDTQIENRLMKVESLQGMTRLRQIGNYAIDYLYRNRCSLDDLIRHLEGLARYKESVDDENGDLVEKGSDFNAVQVMTIHASKGLEFPVVISVAGFKGYNPNVSAPFLYHDAEKKLHLGFGDEAKQARKNEELEEWKRLFYVDFTRASSILVLPQYKKWNDEKSEYYFLQKAIGSVESIAEKKKNTDEEFSVAKLESSSRSDFECKDRVKAILKEIDYESFKMQSKSEERNDIKLDDDIKKQKSKMTELQKKLPESAIMQFSYSNLSKNAKVEEETSEFSDENGSPVRKDGVTDDAESQNVKAEKKGTVSLKDIDTDVVTKNCDTIESREEIVGEDKYPRGSKIGDALHNVLEHVRFKEFGEKYKTLQQALENPSAKLKNAIDEEFKAGSLPIEKNRDAWNAITIRYIWNTLNTNLPVIAGGEFVKNATPFKLTSIQLADHKPEVRFDLNADVKDVSDAKPDSDNAASEALALLHRVCKGFIDLLFVREVDGVKRYSILDWKSDTLEDYSYDKIKGKVDHEYSVQRVLYSYCLIQWLKQFYGKRKNASGVVEGLDEQQIFKKHFGGIYYAFLRGTVGDENSPISETSKPVCHGIYAQTWKNYATLKAAYEQVRNELMRGDKNKDK